MTPIGRTAVIAFAVVIASLAPRAATAFPGDLDPTFGTAGVVDIPTRPPVYRVAVQPDHAALVLAGTDLLRFDAAGTLDATFGSGGAVTPPIAAGGLALQPDGMILVAGSSGGQFAVARYDSTGALDPLFGVGGVATAAAGTYASGTAAAVQSTGAIVVAGTVTDAGNALRFGLARFTAGGGLDATFGTNGVVITPIAGNGVVTALRLAGADALVVAGYSMTNGATVARYDAAGGLDGAFASGGIFTIPDFAIEQAMDAAVEPDDAIVITGFDPYLMVETARITAAGMLDATFGGDGVVSADVSDFATGNAVVIEPGGEILVSGALVTVGPFGMSSSDFALFRYTASGSPDGGFGVHGVVRTNLGQSESIDTAALDGDRLVVGGGKGGDAPFGGPAHFVLARYDAGELCHVAAPCKADTSGKSGLQLRTDPTPDKNRLQWTYRKGDATTFAELGDPTTTDDYVLCIFDESGPQPVATQSFRIRPGGSCDQKPCWSAIGDKGFRYKAKTGSPDGVTALALKAGAAGKTSITAKGAGGLLPSWDLPRALPLRVQLQIPNAGTCWESTFSATGVRRNDSLQLKAKSE